MASVVIRENSIRANIIESEFLDASSLKLARAKAKRYVERRFLRVVLKIKIDTYEYWTVLESRRTASGPCPHTPSRRWANCRDWMSRFTPAGNPCRICSKAARQPGNANSKPAFTRAGLAWVLNF